MSPIRLSGLKKDLEKCFSSSLDEGVIDSCCEIDLRVIDSYDRESPITFYHLRFIVDGEGELHCEELDIEENN